MKVTAPPRRAAEAADREAEIAAFARRLEAVERAVAELREDRRPRARLRDQDDVTAFVAIAAHVGATRHTAAAILEHARRVAPRLLAALQAADVADSARALGHLLRRVEGKVIEGLVLRRVGTSGSGIIWRIEPSDQSEGFR
jgi:hypothetical protein